MFVTSSSSRASCSSSCLCPLDELVRGSGANTELLCTAPDDDPNKPPEEPEVDASNPAACTPNNPPVAAPPDPNRLPEPELETDKLAGAALNKPPDELEEPGEKRPPWLDSAEGLENRPLCVPEAEANNDSPAKGLASAAVAAVPTRARASWSGL
mmetsp:Transcript_99918/g.278232  ORF Transcript_99918/g.278232 Transcript_99918/m.278232 type:complete len:155 (-) Transcript_99918:1815-2279(-)